MTKNNNDKLNFTVSRKQFPQIYVYSDIHYPGLLKIGYTTQEKVMERIKQQYGASVATKKKPYKLEYKTEAFTDEHRLFTDKEVHRVLKKMGLINTNNEWFECTLDDVKAAIQSIKKGIANLEKRTQDFGMRPEQQKAVDKTYRYFKENEGQKPRFLWNAKMRFGKTFTTYQLAKKMEWKRVLILTFKPAVEESWRKDLLSHFDFTGWEFVSMGETNTPPTLSNQPTICFCSLQNLLGKKDDEIKLKNKWIHELHWDAIVFDEYHFGAWRDKTTMLITNDIDANFYLYLSGTPFRALSSGEFDESQVYNWTYADEQRAKRNWNHLNGDNPYAALPELNLLTYELPEEIRNIALKGEFNEFSLGEFFKAEGEKTEAKFIHENEVQKWLDLLRGALVETTEDNLRLGAVKPPFPYDDVNLLEILTHTLWYLPSVSSCYAMKNLLSKPMNIFYHDYEVIVCAGSEAGIGANAIKPVKEAIKNGLNTKTITLSCGKLTTGVTINEWTGIFMLRNIDSAENYFQSAFRVQSPWVIKGDDNENIIHKKQCFVFDFAPDRALKQIATYCDKLDTRLISPEKKIQEFINFLPVLAYNGFAMVQVDAESLIEIAMTGTSSELLAKGWNSILLVNVDKQTLQDVLNDERALQAIMSIEGFRNAKKDLDIVISKSEALSKFKEKEKAEGLTKEEKKERDDARKEYDKKRKEIINKLKIFATRIPLFMYLTDKREDSLQDVILHLDSGLFKRVTGLTIDDFKCLVELGLFNRNMMNQAVYQFRKHEDSSMSYSGINRHEGEKIGLFDTSINETDSHLI